MTEQESQARRMLSKALPIVMAGLGAFILILLLGIVGTRLNHPLLLGSFGASCVLVFGFPDLPFSQPRNLIFGHLLSSVVGLGCLALMGSSPWAMATAVAVALMLMMMSETVHPPAGSNPVIIFLTQPGWDFLFMPTLAGVVLILGVALIYNNSVRGKKYPKYWRRDQHG